MLHAFCIPHEAQKDKCDFPKGTNYKAVTQATVDATCCAHDSSNVKKVVAAITPVLASASAGPSPYPVAEIMGHTFNPTGYTG